MSVLRVVSARMAKGPPMRDFPSGCVCASCVSAAGKSSKSVSEECWACFGPTDCHLVRLIDNLEPNFFMISRGWRFCFRSRFFKTLLTAFKNASLTIILRCPPHFSRHSSSMMMVRSSGGNLLTTLFTKDPLTSCVIAQIFFHKPSTRSLYPRNNSPLIGISTHLLLYPVREITVGSSDRFRSKFCLTCIRHV